MNTEGIVFNHIHQALNQVQELKARVLENQLFRGYSANARAIGGFCALIGAVVLSSPAYPEDDGAHLFGWGAVCVVSFVVNYIAVVQWYLKHDQNQRDLALLRPAFDAVPALTVGGVLTFTLLQYGITPLLFGVWMCLFGLMNCSSRRSLPRAIWYVGWYYIFCGSLCLLLADSMSFSNPWPMGLVFGFGELAGAFIFFKHGIASNG